MKSRNTRYFEISLSVTSNPTKNAVFVTKLIYCIHYSNISRRIFQFLYVTARGRCSLYTVTYPFFAISLKPLMVITSIRAYFLAQSPPCILVGSSGVSLVSLCQYVCLFVRSPQCGLLDSVACYMQLPTSHNFAGFLLKLPHLTSEANISKSVVQFRKISHRGRCTRKPYTKWLFGHNCLNISRIFKRVCSFASS